MASGGSSVVSGGPKHASEDYYVASGELKTAGLKGASSGEF